MRNNSDLDRLPPHNREAERSILGSMLRDNRVIPEIVMLLRAEEFYVFGHQKIFEGLATLMQQGKAADYITLGDWLEEKQHLEDVGGHSYLVDLWDAAPGSAGNARHYADIVRQKAMVRVIIHLGNELAEAAQEQQPPEEMLEVAYQRLGDFTERLHPGNIVTESEVIDLCMRELDRRNSQTSDDAKGTPIKTGFYDLDGLIGGLVDVELIIGAARPGEGKTLCGGCMMRNIARRGLPVFFVSLEQRVQELGDRQLAATAWINGRRLREASVLTIDERGRILDAADRLRPLPIFYDDTPYQSMQRIAATARRLKRQHGIRVLLVDYVQLFQPANSKVPDTSRFPRSRGI
jgi:replicative DNA helicase